MSDSGSEVRPPDDVVEAGAAALRGEHVPAPQDGLWATVAASATARDRRTRRLRIMRYTTIGGLVATLALAAGIFWPHETAQASPLLRAVEHQAKARSYRAVERITLTDGTGREIKIYHADGKERRGQSDGKVSIYDGHTGRMTTFDPKGKTARLDRSGATAEDVNQHSVLRELVRDAVAKGTIKDIGIQVVDGRRLRAYQHEADGRKSTYWVDTQHDWLVKSEEVREAILYYEMMKDTIQKFENVTVPQPKRAFVTVVTEYLGFDEDLDPALFDQTIPEGYKVLVEPPAPEPAK